MVVIAGLLLFFLFWKEWTRNNAARIFQRLLASLLAVGSLFCLAYAFQPATNNRSAINVIVTDGFIPDSLTAFVQQKNQPVVFFSTSRSLVHASPDFNMQWINSLQSFSAKFKDDTFPIFGNGFPQEELDSLNDHPVVFHPNPAVPSVTAVYWKQSLETGEPLVIQGQYENVSAQEIKILLQAFHETVDSVVIPVRTRRDFSLHTIPRHSGKAIYTLVVLSATDTLEINPVPVDVNPVKPFQILFLSSSPVFENTFLKNRLAQNGYGVTMRTLVSKNKSHQEFLNMPVQPAVALTTSYLEKFDLLIADNDALDELSDRELSAIRSVIANGLGLIIKMNTGKNSPSFFSRLFPVYLLKQEEKSFSFLHTVASDSNRYKIRMENPYGIRYQPGTQILLQDDHSAIFASGAVFGNGKIVAVTLDNTFSMALSGNNLDYQSLWSFLLQKAVKKTVPDEIWQVYPELPVLHEPVQLQAVTDIPGKPQGLVGNSKIYLRQNPILPWQWQGKFWPVENGWQTLIQLNGKIYDWYVYKSSDWERLFNFRKSEETKRYAVNHPATFLQTRTVPAGNRTRWLRFTLLTLFITCCAYLWIEQKSG